MTVPVLVDRTHSAAFSDIKGGEMPASEITLRNYQIKTLGTADVGLYKVSYVLRAPQLPTSSGRAKKAPQHVATVDLALESVQWDKPPVDEPAALEDFSADALRCAKLVRDWLGLVTGLIGTVDDWAKDLGWSTKWIEKPMEDSEVGKYQCPALLMQEETMKILLEPITRRAPGAEAVVDLYLMPGFDDIASIYYSNKKWNLYYASSERKAVTDPRKAETKALTKAIFRRVMEELKAHAE